MAASPLDDLRTLLGTAPAGLAGLNKDDQQQLIDTLRRARVAQHADHAAAFDKALAHIPALLRGPVRRIIYG
ncbi:MAG: hypothetical protein ACRERR_04285 [Moraxellaceae bacterium]